MYAILCKTGVRIFEEFLTNFKKGAGGTALRFYGVTALRCYGITALWHYGIMVLWHYGGIGFIGYNGYLILI
jgi:hypothetical protein